MANLLFPYALFGACALFISILFFLLRNRQVKLLLFAAVMASAIFLPAAAQQNSGPMLGMGSITNPWEGCIDNLDQGICNNTSWGGSYVYFGTYQGRNIKYRVLNTSEEAFTSYLDPQKDWPTMLLDCDTVVRKDYRFGRNHDTYWHGSHAQTFLQGPFFESLTSDEQKAVAVSRKTAPSGSDGLGSVGLDWVRLKGDTIFLLDAKEATKKEYGYRWGDVPEDYPDWNDGARIKKDQDGFPSQWYLRSIGKGAAPDEGENEMPEDFAHKDDDTPEKYVGIVRNIYPTAGSINFERGDTYSEPTPKGISPALNVKMGSVIFSHLISGTAGEDGAEYKLTVQSDDIAVTLTGNISINDTTISIPYQVTGDFTRVYGIVTDHEFTESTGWLKNINGAVWTNGKLLMQTSGEARSGTLTLTMDSNPGHQLYILNWDSEYYIYLIAEKENDGTLTNYANIPLKVERPEHVHNWVYAAEGNKISARCDAPLHSGHTTDELFIDPPSTEQGKPEYDGTAKEASLRSTGYNGKFSDIENYPIRYYQCAGSNGAGTENDQCEDPVDLGNSLPVSAGKYKAAVTVYGETAEVTYRIYQAIATVDIKNQTIPEGGSIQTGTDQAVLSNVVKGHKLSAINLYRDETYIRAVIPDTKITDEDGRDMTANYVIMHHPGTLTIMPAVNYLVIFKVVNGRWNDKDPDAKTLTLLAYEGQELYLTDDQIPKAGDEPAPHYRKEGSWGDPAPDTVTPITGNATFIYTYARNPVDYKVTFRVVNGMWNDTSRDDKPVTLSGFEDEELTLSAEQIPTAGDEPDPHFQTGIWGDPAPDTVTPITGDTVFTYTYDRIPVNYKVTFKVVNGMWNDKSRDDQPVTLSGFEGEDFKLTDEQIPKAGDEPDPHFQAGSWGDPAPDTVTPITGDIVFTYTYDRIPVSYNVTFKVVNGLWNDKSRDDKPVTLSGYEGEDLKLIDKQIPAAGDEPDPHYQAGSWDTEPDTVTPITGDAVYTYTYGRIPVSYQVTFSVVNGRWNDGSSEDKTVTLSGWEGETLSLSDSQIPGVGGEPNKHYRAGSWDTEPDTVTPITGDTSFTYTYERIPVSYLVTFRVLNGQWDDEAYENKTVTPKGSGDRTVTLSGYEDEDLTLSAEQIPTAGGKPDKGYTAGSWDKTPDTKTPITGDTVFTYTYAEDQRPAIRYQVTFIVVNGRWNDGSSENKIVILSGYEEDILKLTAAQIPGVGNEPDEHYKAGSWDTTPDTETAITGDTVFTYTYAGEDEPVDPPCPCCCDCILPPTGFSANRQTVLPEQPKELRYTPSGMRLMIPSLDVDSELVTVPLNGNTWSVEWLGSQSGILEGSALPGRGLSLIAAHNSLNEAESGPFALVSLLEPNDVIAVKGKRNDLKIFRVFANELLAPDDMKRVNAVAGREANTLVLITCENESAEGGYLNRRVIFAKPAE